MSSPEQIFRPPEYFAPDTGSGGPSATPSGPEKTVPLNRQFLLSKIEEIRSDDVARAHFVFAKLGKIMPELEDLGILPRVPDNPNPFDAVYEEQKHDEWWKAHPEEGEAFSRAVEEQTYVLKLLYLGAALNQLINEITLPKHPGRTG